MDILREVRELEEVRDYDYGYESVEDWDKQAYSAYTEYRENRDWM